MWNIAPMIMMEKSLLKVQVVIRNHLSVLFVELNTDCSTNDSGMKNVLVLKCSKTTEKKKGEIN